MRNNIDNFVMLTLVDDKKIMININKIDHIKEDDYEDSDSKYIYDCCLIYYSETFCKVKESIEEVLKKINQVSRDNQNDLIQTIFVMVKEIQELQNGD